MCGRAAARRRVQVARICGNFCGPGWCAGQFIDESKCDAFSAQPTGCADACCQAHDNCCKEGREALDSTGDPSEYKTCNYKIVDCLNECIDAGTDQQCLAKNGSPYPVSVIRDAMRSVEGECGGSSCTPS